MLIVTPYKYCKSANIIGLIFYKLYFHLVKKLIKIVINKNIVKHEYIYGYVFSKMYHYL